MHFHFWAAVCLIAKLLVSVWSRKPSDPGGIKEYKGALWGSKTCYENCKIIQLEMWKKTFALDWIQKCTWKRCRRRKGGWKFRSPGVPQDHLIFCTATLFLSRSLFLSSAMMHTYTNPLLFSLLKNSKNPNLSLYSFYSFIPRPFIYFFSRVQYSFFPQG